MSRPLPINDVAIAHTGEDRKIAAKIAKGLRKRGISVWIDPDPLVDGFTPVKSIIDTIESSRAILFLCSTATMKPVWQANEIQATISHRLYEQDKVVLFPVMVEPCELPREFSWLMYFDMTKGDFEERLDQLTIAIGLRLHKRNVFICHSSRDKECVRPIVDSLREQRNISLWCDEDSLKAGSVLRRGIELGIAKADYLIAVLSHNAIDTIDGWIGFELDQAYERERSRNEMGHYFAIPVLIDSNVRIPGWLGTKVYVDLTRDFSAGIAALVSSVSTAPPVGS